jgi:bacterial/archaeal transporter family protein
MWWLLFACLSGLGAALLAILIKVGLKNVDSFILSFLFSVSMALIFFLVGIFFQKFEGFSISALTRKEVLFLIITCIINAGAFLAYFTALQYGKAQAVFTIDRLSIVYVVLLSIFILREAWSYSAIIGAFLMMAGAWLIVS